MSNREEYIGLVHERAHPSTPWPLRKVGLCTTCVVLVVNSLLIVCLPVRRASEVPVELIFRTINYCTNVTLDRILEVAGVLPDYKLVRGVDDYGHLFLYALAGAIMWGAVAVCGAWVWRQMEGTAT